jgi:hypothetical protein
MTTGVRIALLISIVRGFAKFRFFTAFPIVLLPAQSFGWLVVAFAVRGL